MNGGDIHAEVLKEVMGGERGRRVGSGIVSHGL